MQRSLDECTDELEVLAADEMGDESLTGRIRKRIEEVSGPKKNTVLGKDQGVKGSVYPP